MKTVRTYPRRLLSVAMAVFLLAALVPFQPVIAFGVTEGDTWYVDGMNGSDADAGTSAEPFETIFRAVDVASDGDTILVRPGHYWADPLVIGGFTDLTIASTGGPALTVLDGDDDGSPVVVIGGSNGVTIDGFTVTRGRWEVGGGFLVEVSEATISNCIVTACEAEYGGGLVAFDSTLTVEGCEFTENFAWFAGAGLAVEDSTLTVTDCEFTDNGETVEWDWWYEESYTVYSEFSGGMDLYDSSVTIDGSTFSGNTAESGAGALAWGCDLEVSDSVFESNRIEESSYEPWDDSGRTYSSDKSFLSNPDRKIHAQDLKAQQIGFDPTYGAGAGLAVYDGDYTVSGSEFVGNEAYWYGGGLYAGFWADLEVSDSSFEGNAAEFGAGLYFDEQMSRGPGSASKPTSWDEVAASRSAQELPPEIPMPTANLMVERSTFSGNSSLGAPALYFVSDMGTAMIANCLFESNTSPWIGTIAAFSSYEEDSVAPVVEVPVEESADVMMANCTLANNVVGASSALYGMGTSWDVRNTLLWGNPASGEDEMNDPADARIWGSATFSYCDLELGAASYEDTPTLDGVGNFSDDPLFGEGYNLTPESPCVDTGTSESAPLDDIDGWVRPMDGDGDGLRAWDVGAYEYYDALAGNVGANRYETAVKACQQHFDAAQTVVVATGEVFADGLSAAGLAGSYEAPILLSPTSVMPALVKAEIERLGATDAIVIGGVNAISSGVMADLEGMGLAVERIGGADRYETAALVAEALAVNEGDAFSGVGFVARGDTFPDALSVSPIAYAMKSPILLVRPDSLPQATVDVIEALDFDEFMVAGGPDAVSSMAVGGLAAETVQIGGLDRYDTSAKISDYAVDKGWAQMSFTGIATGENFPDALTGGAALGTENGVLLLTPQKALHSAPKFLMQKRADEVKRVEVFGGTAAVSQAVWDAIDAILN